jgi:hypothetical protein
MERRIVAQLFDSIDYLSSLGNVKPKEDGSHDHSTPQEVPTGASAAVAEGIIGAILGGASSKDVVDVQDAAAEEKPAKSKLVVLIAATNK